MTSQGKQHGGEERERERERERVRERERGYNLRVDSWVALAELDEDRAVVDDDLLGVRQLQYVAKEDLCDDVFGWQLVPLKRTLSKRCQCSSTVAIILYTYTKKINKQNMRYN